MVICQTQYIVIYRSPPARYKVITRSSLCTPMSELNGTQVCRNSPAEAAAGAG